MGVIRYWFIFVLFASGALFGDTVACLHIGKDQAINSSTHLYVKLALEEFKKEGAKYVLLELDTPGGEVFSAMEISSLLRHYSEDEGIPVIAYIDTWAISAGALLAYSCPTIVVKEASIMGAAEPIIMGGGEEPKPASEKMVSALRAEFASTAEFYGRDPNIAEAMVDKDIILVKRKGKVIRLQRESDIRKKDEVISGYGKLLTLRGKELEELGIASTLLEAHQGIESAPPLDKIEDIHFISFNHWKVRFYSFLSNPFVASILMTALMFGFYIEVSTPGFGIPGIIALVALGLILLTSFTVYTAGYLELILLAVGGVLILLELFVTPGFGILGILGLILTMACLFLLFLPRIDMGDLFTFQLNPIQTEVLFDRLTWVLLSFILCCGIVVAVAKLFSKFWRPHSPLVLDKTSPAAPLSFELKSGELGRAFTTLRPAGKVEIGNQIYDAITEGRFIEKGKQIKVLRQEGEKVVVEQLI